MPIILNRFIFSILLIGCVFFQRLPVFQNYSSKPEIKENQAVLSFPEQITFSLETEGMSQIREVWLIYGTSARTCQPQQARRFIKFKSQIGASVVINASWELKLMGNENLPPGSELWWQWEIIDRGENTTLTEKKSIQIEDTSFNWMKLSQGPLTIYWIDGDTSFGSKLLEISSNALTRLYREAGLDFPKHVQIFIYPDAEYVKSAAQNLPDWTGGVAFPEYAVILTGISHDGLEWAEQVLPHELAHLATETRVFNCKGVALPTWLAEGISVYAEGGVQKEDQTLLEQAAAKGTLPPLRTLATGFAANARRANLAYSQSGSVVDFMIRTYGAEKLDALLEAVRLGTPAEEAIPTIYGADLDEIDRGWRESIGVKQQVTAVPTSTPFTPHSHSYAGALGPWRPDAPHPHACRQFHANS